MDKKTISKKRKAYILGMRCMMWLSIGITVALVLFMLGYVLAKGLPNISWELLSTKPSQLRGTIGILPDILNTLYIILATLLIVLPLGVGAAIYLTEYAKNKKLVKCFDAIVEKATSAAKEREAVRKTKELNRAKSGADSTRLLGKLAGCSSRDSSLNEIFIV